MWRSLKGVCRVHSLRGQAFLPFTLVDYAWEIANGHPVEGVRAVLDELSLFSSNSSDFLGLKELSASGKTSPLIVRSILFKLGNFFLSVTYLHHFQIPQRRHDYH
jgi:hypothetical protein